MKSETSGNIAAVGHEGTEPLPHHMRRAQALGIVHDFNNIIASIIGFASLAQLQLVGNDEVRHLLGLLLTAGERAGAVGQQILALARADRTDGDPLALYPILVRSADTLRAIVPSNIEIFASSAADAPSVVVDATDMRELLISLGIQAWHAMTDHPGRIEFVLERIVVSERDTFTEKGLKAGLHARISVRVAGGRPNASIVHPMVERYTATDSLGARAPPGVGRVYEIVHRHHGVLSISHPPEGGRVVDVYFPGHEPPAVGTPPEIGSVPHGQGEPILLVDDDDLLAELGQRMLTSLGYRAESVTGPRAALEVVRRNPNHFRLALIDQTMPVMTGLELADELRKLRADLPIILLTGHSASVTPEQLVAAGIRQRLTKPATLRALANAVHAVCATTSPDAPVSTEHA